MGYLASATEKVLSRFQAVKVLRMVELMALLSCSVRTAHRRLKDLGALNSYNCNGRFYTIPTVACFDTDGLWRFRKACFSQHGNLTETVVAVVHASPSGLTASELSKKLDVNAHSFISRLAAGTKLGRGTAGGMLVYLSPEAATAKRQLDARLRPSVVKHAEPQMPTDAEAILILATMIQHPGLLPEQVCRHLTPKGLSLSPEQVLLLLERLGLQKKRRRISTSYLR